MPYRRSNRTLGSIHLGYGWGQGSICREPPRDLSSRQSQPPPGPQSRELWACPRLRGPELVAAGGPWQPATDGGAHDCEQRCGAWCARAGRAGGHHPVRLPGTTELQTWWRRLRRRLRIILKNSSCRILRAEWELLTEPGQNKLHDSPVINLGGARLDHVGLAQAMGILAALADTAEQPRRASDPSADRARPPADRRCRSRRRLSTDRLHREYRFGAGPARGSEPLSCRGGASSGGTTCREGPRRSSP